MPERVVRILSVDDFAMMRNIVRNILKQLGYLYVDEAENGEEALAALRKKKYDLIISDWIMPGKTGIELLREVRADPKLKDTPFLMVTADAARDKVVEAVDAGVNSYVLKPFTPSVLGEQLARILPR
jgi:two-component system chemotaxis response regulator CheY